MLIFALFVVGFQMTGTDRGYKKHTISLTLKPGFQPHQKRRKGCQQGNRLLSVYLRPVVITGVTQWFMLIMILMSM